MRSITARNSYLLDDQSRKDLSSLFNSGVLLDIHFSKSFSHLWWLCGPAVYRLHHYCLYYGSIRMSYSSIILFINGSCRVKHFYTTCLVSALCVCISINKILVYCYDLYYFLKYHSNQTQHRQIHLIIMSAIDSVSIDKISCLLILWFCCHLS